MTPDVATLDGLFSSADPALVVVTTIADGVRAGCLVGFHAQAGIDPPFYACQLSKANHTYRVGLLATHFAVHFLTTADTAVAEHFGHATGEDGDKFVGYATTASLGGVPLLDDLPHRFEGTRRAVIDVGADHVCLLLAIERAAGAGTFTPLRVSREVGLTPGHEAGENAIPVRWSAGG